MNAIVLSFLVVVGSTVLSVAGMLFVRKRFPIPQLREHHEVAGYLVGIVGTLYAVLLGLVVVDVQGKYQQARMMEETEASAAADLFHLADSFPQPTRAEIQKALLEYVSIILDVEWNSAEAGQFTVESTKPLRKIWKTFNVYEPTSNHEQLSYSQALVTLTSLSDSRRYRIVASNSSVPAVLWTVLVSGGVLTILFTYFFAFQSWRSQMVMTTMLTLCLSLNVLLVLLYSNPYRGDLRVKPVGFQYDRGIFRELIGP